VGATDRCDGLVSLERVRRDEILMARIRILDQKKHSLEPSVDGPRGVTRWYDSNQTKWPDHEAPLRVAVRIGHHLKGDQVANLNTKPQRLNQALCLATEYSLNL
jgi:hypothetical protein